jgi:pimeloyl-ACP methyl ester carboxylesterase
MIIVMRYFLLMAALALSAQTRGPEGVWESALATPAAKLRLGLTVTRGADGALSAKFDSIDQGAFGLPLQDVSFTDGVLKFALKAAGASFEGKLNTEGTEIAGTFRQGLGLPLVWKRVEKIEKPKRPQEPKPPFPYKVEEVSIPNPAAKAPLAGTLTIPEGKGRHPAVILITGSGPQDRDESIMGHKPFWVLADHLTRRGIAVLRYDDRGTGKSGGTFRGSTTEDFAADAGAAFQFLARRAEINAKRVGMLGHSEGGLIAPLAASKNRKIAFVVLLAGPGVAGGDVILKQIEYAVRQAGGNDAGVELAQATQKKIYAAMREGGSNEEIEKRVKALLPAGAAGEQARRQVMDPWFRFFVFYDPAPALEKVKAPLLALFGELDRQVDPGQNHGPVEAALKKGGNRKAVVMTLPKLNHLFQTAKTGAANEYAQIEETTAPAALDAISGWIRKTVRLER